MTASVLKQDPNTLTVLWKLREANLIWQCKTDANSWGKPLFRSDETTFKQWLKGDT